MTENGEPFLPGPVFAAPVPPVGRSRPSPSSRTARYEQPHLDGVRSRRWARSRAATPSCSGPAWERCRRCCWRCSSPATAIVIPSDAYYNVRQLAHDLLPYEVREVPTDTAAVVEAAPGRSSSGSRRRRTRASTWSTSVPSRDACDGDPRGGQHARRRRSASGRSSSAPTTSWRARRRRSAGTATCCSGTSPAATSMRFATARGKLGTIAGPFEVWLAHRSLATLDVRLERECANALRLAEAIGEHVPVRYPGLPERPRARDREGADGPLRRRCSCFTLPDAARGRRVPRGGGAGHRGHELRRRAHDGRAPRALGRRRRAGGLHPPERRLRGPRRARAGRDARVGAGAWRARRIDPCPTGSSG